MITVEEIMSWGPCPGYPESRLRALIGDGVSFEAWLKVEIPAEDRIWVCCRCFPRPVVKRAVRRIVIRAVTNQARCCGIEEVETWAARWLSGKDRSWAAAAAAREAAWPAAEPAMCAARAAQMEVRALALAAAWPEAAMAVDTAALAAAQAVAWADAERKWQIADFDAAMRA